MRRLARCLLIVSLSIGSLGSLAVDGFQDRVYYLYKETISTPEEVREHLHYFGVTAGVVSYSLEERVYGCNKPRTTRTRFSHFIRVPASEQKAIFEELIAKGVY